MDYILTTSALAKKYGRAHALKDVSMHIPKGSIYGFVGRNGSGKTTLIRLITGLQEPTDGDYSLYGIPYKDKEVTRARRRVGAVVETPAIYLNLSAEDNLKQQCLTLGIPSYDDIPRLLKLVGLENTGKKTARKFSLGMKQRLGIAIALVGNPDFIILDEPTNGLDPQGIIDMRELILRLNRDLQITFLISSHILDELSKLATHYGFIDNGTLIKEISANELEAECRISIRLKVSNINALSQVLDELSVEYEIISEDTAKLYEKVNLSQLVVALAEKNCELLSSHEQEESLENYFINLVGGGTHE